MGREEEDLVVDEAPAPVRSGPRIPQPPASPVVPAPVSSVPVLSVVPPPRCSCCSCCSCRRGSRSYPGCSGERRRGCHAFPGPGSGFPPLDGYFFLFFSGYSWCFREEAYSGLPRWGGRSHRGGGGDSEEETGSAIGG